MIEAVNSVIANASLLRANAEQSQADRLNSMASQPVQQVEVESAGGPIAPFVSPFIQMNNTYNKAVLQIRDSNTGDVVNQFPSETTLRARAAQAEIDTQVQIADAVTPRSPDAPQSAASFSRLSPAVRFENAMSAATSGAPRVAEAQIASAAFSAQAMSGQVSSSVSVVA